MKKTILSLLLTAAIAVSAKAEDLTFAWDNTYQPGEVETFTLQLSQTPGFDNPVEVTIPGSDFSVLVQGVGKGVHFARMFATGTNGLSSDYSVIVPVFPQPVGGLTIRVAP